MKLNQLIASILLPFGFAASAFAANADQGGSVKYYANTPSKSGNVAVQIPSPTMKCPACEVYVKGKWRCKTQAEAANISGAPTMCKTR